MHIYIHTHTHMSIFSFLFVLLFFSSILCIVAKKGKRWRRVLGFFFFVFFFFCYTQHIRKTFGWRPCMTLLLSSSLSSSWSLRRFLCVYTSIYIYMCVYVFFHFNCCSCFYPDRHDVYRYAILCRCRLVLFLRFFLRMFFFRFDWRSKYWMLYAVSFLSLFLLSVTIHFSRVLLCLSYTAPSCSVSMRAIRIFCFKKKKKRIAKRIISTRLSYVEVEKREILVNSFVALTEHYRD